MSVLVLLNLSAGRLKTTPAPTIAPTLSPSNAPTQVPTPPPVYLLNNDSSYINYSGGWSAITQNGAGQYNTISLTNSTTAVARLEIIGPTIKFYSKKGPKARIIEIWIDGVLEESVDLYSPTKIFQVLAYENTNLSFGSHIFEIKNTNRRNPASTGSYAHIDWIECSM